MSTHNIGFYEDLTKIIFELSSNTHLISSAESVHLISTFIVCFNDSILCLVYIYLNKLNKTLSSLYSRA